MQILKLCQSPRKLLADLLGILDKSSDPAMRLNSFMSLQKLAADYTMAEELVRGEGRGFERVLTEIRRGDASAQEVANLIATLYEVMKHEVGEKNLII